MTETTTPAKARFADADNPTVEELLALDDRTFADEASEDLEYTAGHQSPFQDPLVIRRTLTALLEKVWFADQTLHKYADDASVTAERYEATARFRRFLLSVVDITERRLTWMDGGHARQASAWKKILHEVLDALDGGPEEWILDEFKIPFHNMTLKAWREIRRVKDPRRVPVKEVAA